MIVASTAIAREATAFGFPGDISVIPNPVDTDRFRPAPPADRTVIRQRLGLPIGAQIVTYVTRLVQGKGLLALARAWQEIARENSRALLVVVGTGPGGGSPLDAEDALREAIRAADLGRRVLLTGSRTDVEFWLQASDMFVFPSEREGFGNALVEAMAVGLPVVSSRIEGAAADLVIEGKQGLKFEVGDVAGLAAAIRSMLADEPLRQRLGAAGLAVVTQRLTSEAIAVAYESVLRQAIERPPGGP